MSPPAAREELARNARAFAGSPPAVARVEERIIDGRLRARVYVPGYWGYHSGVRVWIGGSWAFPPYAGWFWVAPHWQWNGYQWVWQEGYWAPPAY